MPMSSGANMMPQQQVPVSDASMYGQVIFATFSYKLTRFIV